MSVYVVNDTDLTAVADAIRDKAEITDELIFPDGFIDSIPNGIPKATKIKYIIPATYIPKRTSDDNGFDVTKFTFTRENVNQLLFVDWRLQDETNYSTNGLWIQDIVWNLYYQGNYNGVHNFSLLWWGGGNKGNHGITKYFNFGKTVLTTEISVGNNTITDANYKRHGTTYKGLIFIYDSSYNGAPIVDETKLSQYFTNCNGQLTEGM
jgi:hypothetical protein